ncbi:MAG: PDZ domain-containing protein [Myxococcales bacterium]|nr:PDZ domain-containing protein [Myxococcales bacterium]
MGQVFPGGPADDAGLLAGDVVVEVDGESTARWSLVRTARQMRGPAGTKVRMGIERGDQRLDVVVERRAVAVPPPPAR